MVYRILRPDSTSVWNNKEIVKRFSRYKGIIDDVKIARYLIAKSVDCNYDINDPLEKLEEMLKKKSIEFNELLKLESEELKSRQIYESNFITLAETIANKYLENCIFCERCCEVDRTKGEKGVCLIPQNSYVSSAFLHMGEEAPLIPSGTIFFQGCNFLCVFCQNYEISQTWKGRKRIADIAQKVDVKRLAGIIDKLVDTGAININYVGGDPIPNLHTIVGSLNYQQSNICQLWNSNFYLTDKALSLIIDLMDFWLPDFKFSSKCAEKYSGVKNYFEIISRNLKRIHNEGSGEIIVRHLVVPNHVECCSKPILKFISDEAPKCVVNIMGQFRPEFHALEYPEINRRPNNEEMQQVKDYANEMEILWKPLS